MLNHLDLGKMKLAAGDFFSKVAYYKRRVELFDCVILDPPFFSSTEKGVVDLVNDSMRVINKVRPLVRDSGRLVAINNALYLSGADYMQALERMDTFLLIGCCRFRRTSRVILGQLSSLHRAIRSPSTTRPKLWY